MTILKVMFDSMVYDSFYIDESRRAKLEQLISAEKIKLYSTGIQEAQLHAIDLEKYPEKKERKAWMLRIHNDAKIVSPPFTYNVPGAGWGQGSWATGEQQIQYRKIKPNGNPKNDICDRLIGIAANGQVEIFVTNDGIRADFIPTFQSMQVLSYKEFAALVDKM